MRKLADFLTGMTVLAYSEDPVAAAKVADGFAKDNSKFEILGGAMGENASGRRRCESRCRDAIARGAYRFHRGLHRGTCSQHRRGHWRACKQHRQHSLDDRGRPKRREAIGNSRGVMTSRWNTSRNGNE